MELGKLPVGAVVKDSKSSILFYVAAHDHPGYQGTTLISQYIIGVRAFDARENLNPASGTFNNRRRYGNNDYALSNIHQWLNSDKASGWYSPTHEFDAPPSEENVWYGDYHYENKQGFLHRLSDKFKAALIEVDVPYAVRTGKDSVELRSVKGKAFIPSRTEINYGDEAGMAEGAPFQLFVDDPYLTYAVASPQQREKYGRSWNPPSEYATWDDPGIYDPAQGWKYWLRSACSIYSFTARYMNPDFQLSYDKVCNDVVGVRPAMNLDSSVQCSEGPDGVYVI